MPRLSRYKTEAEEARHADLGDQPVYRTMSSEASVPVAMAGELAENDLFIGMPDIADRGSCRHG